MSKACLKCAVVKPLSDFYQDFTMRDNYYNTCKKCRNKERTELARKTRKRDFIPRNPHE